MLETDQTCDCVGDTKAECVVLDLKEGLCSRQTQSRDLINPGWHSPFYLAGILTHLAPLHSPDWHRELSSKINSADEIIQYKDTWQIRSNSDAHLNTWKPFFFFFLWAAHPSELSHQRINGQKRKWPGYQTCWIPNRGREKKNNWSNFWQYVCCTLTGSTAARSEWAVHMHTQNTKAGICLVFHPSLRTLHIPLHCCLSVGQLSDYCVGTDCE